MMVCGPTALILMISGAWTAALRKPRFVRQPRMMIELHKTGAVLYFTNNGAIVHRVRV